MLRPAKGKVRVIISVVPYFMTFIYNSPNQFWVAFGIYSNEKEGGLDLGCF